jgi:hypothetical protein
MGRYLGGVPPWEVETAPAWWISRIRVAMEAEEAARAVRESKATKKR